MRYPYFRKTSLEPRWKTNPVYKHTDVISKDDMTTIYFNAVFAGTNKAGVTHTRNAVANRYTCIHSN